MSSPDEDFDAWFAELNDDSGDKDTPAEPEIDYEFESEKLLRGLNEELEKVEASFQDELVQIKAIEDEERELRAKLESLARRKREYSDKTWDVRKRIRSLRNTEIPLQEQRVRIDKQNKLTKEKLERERAEFDERTKDAPWRNFAMPHQLEGSAFMASAKRAIIADSMGLGKTLQSIMAADRLNSKRLLIICPGDVMTNFYDEVKRWSPERGIFMLGRKPKQEQKFMLNLMATTMQQFTVILNYETWNRNKAIWEWLADCGFDTAVIDEAHTIKELSKVPYKGVESIVMAQNACDQCGKVAPRDKHSVRRCAGCNNYSMKPSVENFFAMTGTPILNRPTELYPLLHLAHPEIFQTKSRFQRDFCEVDYTGKEAWRPGAQSTLAERISGMYIRRTLDSAGIKLPPQQMIVHEIEIDPEDYKLQTEFIEMVRRDAVVQMEDGRAASISSMLALITRQRQASVWPGGVWMDIPVLDFDGNKVYDLETGDIKYERVHVGKDFQQSAKIDRAVELYHELVDGGNRVVFFSQFKEVLKELKKRLGDEIAEFHGDVSQADRDLVKRNFDRSFGEEPKWQGVAAHFRVGGVGVNFTAATAIIVLDEEWNQGKNDQAYDRIHRMGQTEETQVHILRHVGPGYSIDGWLAQLIKRKSEIVGGFNHSVEELKGAFE